MEVQDALRRYTVEEIVEAGEELAPSCGGGRRVSKGEPSNH
jgi:hypothetical protein